MKRDYAETTQLLADAWADVLDLLMIDAGVPLTTMESALANFGLNRPAVAHMTDEHFGLPDDPELRSTFLTGMLTGLILASKLQ